MFLFHTFVHPASMSGNRTKQDRSRGTWRSLYRSLAEMGSLNVEFFQYIIYISLIIEASELHDVMLLIAKNFNISYQNSNILAAQIKLII